MATSSIPIDADTTVSAQAIRPQGFRAGATTAVILAHGAGSRMTHPFMIDVQRGLADAGYLAVTFNFPYAERGGWPPDRMPVLQACYRHVIDWLMAHRSLRPGALVIGGKSLGGRVASHLAADGTPVDGLLFLGYPLHRPGKPAQLRADHLPRIKRPMLFITGTRDALCDLEQLRGVAAEVKRWARIEVIDGADHSFRVLKRLRRSEEEVMTEIVDASSAWLESLRESGR